MFAPPVMQVLSGERLHLSHGPIDVVLRAWGAPEAVRAAYVAAWARFQTILPELTDELRLLRTPMEELAATRPRAGDAAGSQPLSQAASRSALPAPWVHASLDDPPASLSPPTQREGEQAGFWAGHAAARMEAAKRRCAAASSEPGNPVQGPVARRMFAACLPFAEVFVTPMAAVAGAVADELLASMTAAAPITRAYVNDGGDIAVRVPEGHVLDIAIAGDFSLGNVPALNGGLRLTPALGVGGIATSGARGRSFSLGIADSVTVLARDAATADVAATLVANAVNVESPAISRRPARSLDPDSDLADRLVTVAVGALAPHEIEAALAGGAERAQAYRARGLISDAALMLAGHSRVVGLHHMRESTRGAVPEAAMARQETT